ncbi:MAG: hypothetical protein R3B45_00330 [Bdellovibrionota bacterium]
MSRLQLGTFLFLLSYLSSCGSLQSSRPSNTNHKYLKSQEALDHRSQQGAIKLMKQVDDSWVRSKIFNGLEEITTILGFINKSKKEELIEKKGYKEFFIETEEGSVTQALVKIPPTPRPFLIVTGGLASEVTMSAFTDYAIPIGEKYGLGIVLLEGNTSANWTNRKGNQRMVLSGYEAGWEIYMTIKELHKIPEIASKMAETHLLGLSLGGSDVAYVSYFDSLDEEKRFIDGATIGWNGPLLRHKDFRYTREGDGPLSDLLREKIYIKHYDRIKSIIDRWMPGISKDDYVRNLDTDIYLKNIYFPQTKQYLKTHPHHYTKKVNGKFKLPFLFDAETFTYNQYLRMVDVNDYLNHIENPLLWISNEDDPLVPIESVREFLADHNLPSHIAVLQNKQGGHLGESSYRGKEWVYQTIMTQIVYWGQFTYPYYMQFQNPEECNLMIHRPDPLKYKQKKSKPKKFINICNIKPFE